MNRIVLLATVVLLSLVSCHKQELEIKGIVENYKSEKIYLFEILDQHYGYYRVIDTSAVVEGEFAFTNKNLSPQLYFIGKNRRDGGVVFVNNDLNKLKGKYTKKGELVWNNENDKYHSLYVKYVETCDSLNNQKVLDSFSNLFYAARDKEDRIEMARIKELTSSMYYEGGEKVRNYTSKVVEENKDNLFGLYMYYKSGFKHRMFSTQEEISGVREKLAAYKCFNEPNNYSNKIKESLIAFEKCAVGSFAPEIIGKDTLGHSMKLSDLRGKYVLVDFWSSGCSWCRKETPNLMKAYNLFKDKGFTILGVSSDWKEDSWMKAIHEDKSYWNHLIKDKDNDTTNRDYCISGIPHIILIDPSGKILEKELRGAKIYEMPAKYIK